jgi:hypothetical protein
VPFSLSGTIESNQREPDVRNELLTELPPDSIECRNLGLPEARFLSLQSSVAQLEVVDCADLGDGSTDKVIRH